MSKVWLVGAKWNSHIHWSDCGGGCRARVSMHVCLHALREGECAPMMQPIAQLAWFASRLWPQKSTDTTAAAVVPATSLINPHFGLAHALFALLPNRLESHDVCLTFAICRFSRAFSASSCAFSSSSISA